MQKLAQLSFDQNGKAVIVTATGKQNSRSEHPDKRPKPRSHSQPQQSVGTAAHGTDPQRLNASTPRPKPRSHKQNKDPALAAPGAESAESNPLLIDNTNDCSIKRPAADPRSHQDDNNSPQQLCDIPDRYRMDLLEPEGETTEDDFRLPEGYIILILYAGTDDQTTTAAAIQQEAPWLSQYVVEIDKSRDQQRQDMLKAQPYKQLHQAAQQGRILAVLGGPGHETFTNKPPTRGGHRDTMWGLSANDKSDQAAADRENIQLLRMMELANIARFYNTTTILILLAHPADPALSTEDTGSPESPTIWGTTTLMAFGHNHRLLGTTLSTCVLGDKQHQNIKFLHNIPLLCTLNNQTCPHNEYKGTTAQTRWGWTLNIMIARGISKHLRYLRNLDHKTIINYQQPSNS